MCMCVCVSYSNGPFLPMCVSHYCDSFLMVLTALANAPRPNARLIASLIDDDSIAISYCMYTDTDDDDDDVDAAIDASSATVAVSAPSSNKRCGWLTASVIAIIRSIYSLARCSIHDRRLPTSFGVQLGKNAMSALDCSSHTVESTRIRVELQQQQKQIDITRRYSEVKWWLAFDANTIVFDICTGQYKTTHSVESIVVIDIRIVEIVLERCHIIIVARKWRCTIVIQQYCDRWWRWIRVVDGGEEQRWCDIVTFLWRYTRGDGCGQYRWFSLRQCIHRFDLLSSHTSPCLINQTQTMIGDHFSFSIQSFIIHSIELHNIRSSTEWFELWTNMV